MDQKTKLKIQDQRLKGKRIVAVGTTSVRVLESDWDKKETDQVDAVDAGVRVCRKRFDGAGVH